MDEHNRVVERLRDVQAEVDQTWALLPEDATGPLPEAVHRYIDDLEEQRDEDRRAHGRPVYVPSTHRIVVGAGWRPGGAW